MYSITHSKYIPIFAETCNYKEEFYMILIKYNSPNKCSLRLNPATH